MPPMDRREHWDSIYETKAVTDVSWFEPDPQVSWDLINSGSPTWDRIMDVGGGASRLVDRLVATGCKSVTVVDISEIALEHAKARLGNAATQVHWIVGDICLITQLPPCDIWHDRAVFHFLTEQEDRRKYVDLATRTLQIRGHLIIGTFAVDGPTKCSGLEVCRYDAASLARELGPRFKLVRQLSHEHITPSGKPQKFFFGVFQLLPLPDAVSVTSESSV
jgi:ubiquinone/menaquinone biosynthesis C-methylase UbiE